MSEEDQFYELNAQCWRCRMYIPRAEMKSLGLLSATNTAADGYIGFGYTPSTFTFDATSSVASGTYDFIGIAAHEIDEVLGRISTLNSTSPSGATVFDLFRYAAPGVPNFSRSAASYFSIDGGQTNLGSFNVSGGGDRSDWVYPTGTDAQQAYLPSGQRLSVASADLVALDILGWDSGGTNALVAASSSTGSISASAVPEPRSVILLGIGLLALGYVRLAARRRV